jgi:hypothetical protein
MKKILIPLAILAYAVLAFGHLSGQASATAWQADRTYSIKGGPFQAAHYDADRTELTLVFRSGAAYAYTGVSRKTWLTFMRVRHKGSFFNSHIKPTYESRRVDAAGTGRSTP